MSIRMIAREMYRLQQEVERLEEQLKTATRDGREGLEEQLRKARAERDRMRQTMEGAKEPPPYRTPR